MSVKLIPLVIAGVGVLVLLSGLNLFASNLEVLNKGVPGEAKVLRSYRIENTPSRRKKTNRYSYYAVLEYTARDGRTYTPTISIGATGSTPIYKAGQVLPILYSQNDPTQVQVNTAFDLWSLPGLMTLIGAVALGMGLAGWRALGRAG